MPNSAGKVAVSLISTIGGGAVLYLFGASVRAAELHGNGYSVSDGLAVAVKPSVAVEGALLLFVLLAGGVLVVGAVLAWLPEGGRKLGLDASTWSPAKRLRTLAVVAGIAFVIAVGAALLQEMWSVAVVVVVGTILVVTGLRLAPSSFSSAPDPISALLFGSIVFVGLLFPTVVAYKHDRPSEGPYITLISTGHPDCFGGQYIGRSGSDIYYGVRASSEADTGPSSTFIAHVSVKSVLAQSLGATAAPSCRDTRRSSGIEKSGVGAVTSPTS